jgi:hypothetical protein
MSKEEKRILLAKLLEDMNNRPDPYQNALMTHFNSSGSSGEPTKAVKLANILMSRFTPDYWRTIGNDIMTIMYNLPAEISNFPSADLTALHKPGSDWTPEMENVQNALNAFGPSNMGFTGITAYHGSPYKFNKFKLSKIGSGEGSQVYGHGLYFAESPEVGKTYANLLDKKSAKAIRAIYDAKNTTNNPILYLTKKLEEAKKGGEDLFGGNLADNIHIYQEALNRYSEHAEAITKASKDITDITKAAYPGILYKVEIPDDTVKNFLHWDKPLSEQPNIMKLLKNSDIPLFGGKSMDWTNMPEGTWEKAASKWSGEKIYSDIGKGMTPEQTSEFFRRKLGIPGVRYLDQASRNTSKGTSNFVVFDENLIKILDRK